MCNLKVNNDWLPNFLYQLHILGCFMLEAPSWAPFYLKQSLTKQSDLNVLLVVAVTV